MCAIFGGNHRIPGVSVCAATSVTNADKIASTATATTAAADRSTNGTFLFVACIAEVDYLMP